MKVYLKGMFAFSAAFAFIALQTAYAAGPSGVSKIRRVWTQGDEILMFAASGQGFLNPDQCGDGSPTIGSALFIPATPAGPGNESKRAAETDRALSLLLTAVAGKLNVETYFSGCAQSVIGDVPFFSQVGVAND